MDPFRTEIKIQPQVCITHRSTIFTIGSCFAHHMGAQLSHHKFQTFANPFGTVYNPVSIHQLIQGAIQNTQPDDSRFVQHENIWHHYDYHSSWAGVEKSELVDKLIRLTEDAHQALIKTDVLLITYGTSWIFQHKSQKKAVANCHKVQAAEFDKSLLSTDELVHSFSEMYQLLKKLNPEMKVVLTVSPVRHVRDTLPLNQVSKSVLRVACHQIVEQFPEVIYFPAYEILVDDLRDYRFYESDLIHPSASAQEYIWSKFREQFFSDKTNELVDQWADVRKALMHKAFHPKSVGHQIFLRKTLQRLSELKDQFDVSTEVHEIEAALNA